MMRMLNDRVAVKRDEPEAQKGGLFIPTAAQERQYTGVVVAVGPGAAHENGVRHPLTVVPGDRVLFGKFSGDTVFTDEGEELLVLRESDVIGVLCED